MADPGWSFSGPTAPFFAPDGTEPAVFALRQVDDDRFTLVEGFTYDDGIDRVEVSEDVLVDTDLASIPLFMAWFVPVNGRHTPAALVHDTLVAAGRREHGDAVFLRALEASGVPLLRRRLMHAAVVLATRWSGTVSARIGICLWVVASVLGTVALVWSLVAGNWTVALAALAAPVLAAPLWGWACRGAGTVAGYAAWFIALPALMTAAGYGAYWSAEQLLRLRPRSAGPDADGGTPPPAPFR